MKKTLMLVLIVALAFSCFAAVLTAGASTPIAQGTKTDSRNYFVGNSKMAAGMLDFESGAGEFYQNWSEVSIANGLATIHTYAPAYPMRTAYSGFKVEYKVGQTYYFQLDLKFNDKVNAIDLQIWDAVDCKMDAAFRIIRNEGEVSFALVENPKTEISGYNETQVTQNLTYEKLNNGFYRVMFDVVPTADVTINTSVWYGVQGSTGDGGEKEGEVVFDYIEHGVYESPKYYTVDWDVDYNNYANYDEAYDSQPVHGDTERFTLDESWIDGTQCLKLNVPAAADNAQIGGLECRAELIESKKLIKHAALTYFQYDVALDNCSYLNIWTGSDYYTSVEYKDSNWRSNGFVTGFKAEALENGYRLSYFIDLSANRDLAFNINASSAQGGAVYLDNLVIAYEDYTAYLGTGTYNYNNTEDVAIDFDAKGKDVVSVKLDDATLTAEDYAIADGKLTVKAAKLAGSELGKTYTLSVVTSASETPVTTEIAQYDNREGLYADYTGGELANVTYNGTTNYNGEITLTLIGNIADGDEVTVTKSVALKSKDASNNSVVISNIALAGKDAAKYKLNNTENIEIPIYVLPVQLTITDPTIADKTYNGTAEAEVTAGKLQGILEGDEVTLESATGVFNSKDVATANKVTVSYVIAGKDSANYIAPVDSEVAKTIAKANITVTANAISKTEGETDPELTYTVDGAEQGTQLSGKLARAAGETAGEYDITVGTLAHDNYNINFVGAKFTIKAKASESTGCFGVVGTASVAAFALIAAAAVVVCKRKSK